MSHRVSFQNKKQELNFIGNAGPRPYLDYVLSVLRCVLEHGPTVLQVRVIEAPRVAVHLLKGSVAWLRHLQVAQEVRVDRATLNKAHAA